MSYALPDLTLVTMSEMLDSAARIDAATRLSVIVDCNNGYGLSRTSSARSGSSSESDSRRSAPRTTTSRSGTASFGVRRSARSSPLPSRRGASGRRRVLSRRSTSPSSRASKLSSRGTA